MCRAAGEAPRSFIVRQTRASYLSVSNTASIYSPENSRGEKVKRQEDLSPRCMLPSGKQTPAGGGKRGN